MRIGVTKILWATAVGLLVVGLAVLVWDPSLSGSDGAATGADNSEVAEHVDDAATGDGNSEVAEHVDDAAEHTDAVEPTDADGDEEANAYLEAAPKEALTLIEMTSFAYTPSVIEVGAGEVLEIAIQNAEPALHDFTIDKIDADVHISYLGGTGQHEHQEPERDADVHFALTEPASGVVHLKIYEPGEYVFYCSVPGHREGGMVGTLIVQ